MEQNTQNQMLTVYKVMSEDDWCAFDNLELALVFLKESFAIALKQLTPGDESPKFWIKIDKMSRKEYENLPDFNGF